MLPASTLLSSPPLSPALSSHRSPSSSSSSSSSFTSSIAYPPSSLCCVDRPFRFYDLMQSTKTLKLVQNIKSKNSPCLQPYAGCASLDHLRQPITYRVVALIWWSLLGLAPAYLRDLCCPTMSAPVRRSLCSTERGALIDLLSAQLLRLLQQNRTLVVVDSLLWNGLPLELRWFPRVHYDSFHAQLKTVCFRHVVVDSAPKHSFRPFL